MYLALPSAADTATTSFGEFGTGIFDFSVSRGSPTDCLAAGSPTLTYFLYYSGPGNYAASHLNSGAGAGPNGDCGFDYLLYLTLFEMLNVLIGWADALDAARQVRARAPTASSSRTASPNPAGNIANFSVTDGPTTYYAAIPGGQYGAQGGVSAVGSVVPNYWNAWNAQWTRTARRSAIIAATV